MDVIKEIARVREQIHSAFGGLPVPGPQTLVRPTDARNQPGAKKIQRALAGQEWQRLTAAFLAEAWSSFCYLTPVAYQYYLPALLTRVLESSPVQFGLTHSTVYSLRPSFHALYYAGDDREFRAQQSLLTEAQYRAVCAFLGLMLDGPCPHLAAQALRWGWNALDTPARDAARAEYRRLHTYVAPTLENAAAAAVQREIQAAFAATPYPGDDQLCGSPQGDEPAEYAMELRGLAWQSVHPDLLARCYPALSFLTDEGFRYFLPAFLLANFLEDDSNADPAWHLSRHLDSADRHAIDEPASDWAAYEQNRMAGFTRAERKAIIAFLEYFSTGEHADDDGVIPGALAHYWRPSLEWAPD